MSSPVVSYTPPPPQPSSEGSNPTLRIISYPSAATPLPPSPSSPHAPSSPTGQSQQIRYCYFISASSVAPSGRTTTPSFSQKPVFLTPHVQEPMEDSPNCTQPRSRSSKDASASSSYVFGPNPPQIQLGFLENEPLPSTATLEPPSHLDTVPSTTATTPRLESADGALVERKDSGYGGSVSRSSSLAAFGRGIRKVFWRHSVKDSVESVVIVEPPVLDCEIPHELLDHESWAQDLAQRLSLASAPDAVAAWLGQLPSEHSMDGDSHQDDTETHMDDQDLIQDIVEEVFFLVPPQAGSSIVPHSIKISRSETNLNLMLDSPTTPTSTYPSPPTGKSLRKVLSNEQLNKPQPPLPLISFNSKPTPSLTRETAGSTSPLNTIARKLHISSEFGFSRTMPKSNNCTSRRRPSVQDVFSDSASIGRVSVNGRLSSEVMEEIKEMTSLEAHMVTSPEEMDAPHYLAADSSASRSKRFFKSLTTFTAAEFKASQQNEVRPLSEVLLSNANLSPEEVSAEIAEASRSTSLRSPRMRRAIPQWEKDGASASSSVRQGKERSSSYPLAPPKPLFYSKGISSSVSSLGELSTCGSVDSSAIDSSADEWDGLRMSKITTNLKDLQALLLEADPHRPRYTPTNSTNTSTGSLTLSITSSTTVKKEHKNSKSLSKKDDYMSHRMSGCSLKLTSTAGKTKPRSKSRLSVTFGGGELEVVKHAKFDTPEAIARNKEIRKFISQEIYTTELNYLQYMKTIQEVFVEPLFRSLETEKPFIPRSNALYQLLAHVSTLISVSSQLSQRFEECVRDDVWSDDSSLIGTIFLDAKESLSIFLKYGQSYGRGMKSLRALMKAKRTSIATPLIVIPSAVSPTPPSSPLVPGGPRLDKRRSLPSIISLNSASTASSPSMLSEAMWPETNTNLTTTLDGNYPKSGPKPRSSHGMASELSENERFLHNCAGGKDTTSRFSLADLLILPIQRVTRYCLLMKDLKRHTDVEHPDYVCIVHALEQLHTLAMATNNVQS